VPWDNVKLVYAYTTFVSNISAGGLDGGDCNIALELDAAGGTLLGNIIIADSASVGDVDEVDMTSVAAAKGLKDSNVINVAVDGHGSTTLGAFNIYLYFEPDK